ncbi:MAG TPA: PHP domain-containing protein [Candidatus Acidoferrales bacterium]
MSRQRHLAVSGRSVNPPAPGRKVTRISGELTNANLAELLALEAAKVGPPLNRAFRRASRRAFLWPEEAKDLVRRGGSLADLQGIGPYLERALRKWIAHPPVTEVPLPLRFGFLTLTQAHSILNSEPHWLPGVNGDLQMHTSWSDGTASIADMARAAIEHGYEYIAITDHGKALKIAGGIDEQQLRQQAREIETVNDSLARARQKLRVLHSIELNLSPAGEGDMDPDALAQLDVVIGCFHSSLRRKEDQTARYLAALNNPAIQILGHPRGRIYNFRIGLCADWPQVFDMAAELDKAVEIDAYPDRQDLSPDLLVLARKAGCRISFGTDSHGPTQLRFMAFAAASALQAGIKRERILNFMSREQLLAWVGGIREQSSRFKKKAALNGEK